MASEPEVTSSTRRSATAKAPAGSLRVWSEIHVKVPVPGLDYTMFGFTFGHERFADGSSEASIARAEALCHEFNEKTLEKRLKKLLREVRMVEAGVTAEERGEPEKKDKGKKKGGSVQDRVRKRMEGR